METKQIVEKALKGEDYSVDIKDMSDEDKTKITLAIRDAADVAAKENLAKLSGTAKEIQRREEKDKDGKKTEDIVATFASEQFSKAKNAFFSDPDIKLTDAEKAQIEAGFKTNKVDEQLILSDLKAFYVSLNPDKFLADSKRVKTLEKGAADYNANAAGGGNSGGGAGDDSKYSDAAKKLHAMWQSQGIKRKTMDDAQRIVDRGFDWQKRSLSK